MGEWKADYDYRNCEANEKSGVFGKARIREGLVDVRKGDQNRKE